MTRDGHNEGRVSLVDKIIHVICPSHGVLHLFHGSFHMIHFSLQVWYPTSDGISGLISSLNTVLGPFILWILPVLLATSLSAMSVNFSSQLLVLLCQIQHCSNHGLQLLLDSQWWCWCTVWVTRGVSTLLVLWTSGHWPSLNHAVFLSWKARWLALGNFAYHLM